MLPVGPPPGPGLYFMWKDIWKPVVRVVIGRLAFAALGQCLFDGMVPCTWMCGLEMSKYSKQWIYLDVAIFSLREELWESGQSLREKQNLLLRLLMFWCTVLQNSSSFLSSNDEDEDQSQMKKKILLCKNLWPVKGCGKTWQWPRVRGGGSKEVNGWNRSALKEPEQFAWLPCDSRHLWGRHHLLLFGRTWLSGWRVSRCPQLSDAGSCPSMCFLLEEINACWAEALTMSLLSLTLDTGGERESRRVEIGQEILTLLACPSTQTQDWFGSVAGWNQEPESAKQVINCCTCKQRE